MAPSGGRHADLHGSHWLGSFAERAHARPAYEEGTPVPAAWRHSPPRRRDDASPARALRQPTLERFLLPAADARGVRPVEADPDILVSPVDAVVHTFGAIHKGNFLQYDGKPSSVPALLGGGDPRLPDLHPDLAARYEGGSFAVLYLSPKDYHRVHSPEAGRITTIRYLPGMLWPVFPAATRKIDNLFARNERLVFELETERFGTIAEVMVGAFGVGRMSTLLDPIITNTGGAEVALKPQATVERAGEIGRFEMGSTVILCLEPGRIEWTIKPGQPVRLGRPIARRRVAG